MSRSTRRGWTRGRLALLLGTLAAIVFWGRESLEDIWSFAIGQTDNGYILLAPAVAAYLAWLRRSRIQFIYYRPNLIGPVVVAFGMFASLWGDYFGAHFAWHGGILVAAFGCCYAMMGWELVRQFAPVLMAVALIVPIPGQIREAMAGPAQEFSVAAAQTVLELMGTDAIREGNVIVIAGEPVAVGEACNGMRMVFALGLVVFAFVFSVPFSTLTRVVLVAAAPVVALLCNIIRLVPTSLAYGWLSPEIAEQVHDVGGWMMLPLAVVMLMGVVKVLRWVDLPVMSWRLVRA